MKAAQVVEYGKPYQVNTVPVPSDIGPHDLLVKIATASHCHTDVLVHSGAFGTKLPVTGSHEGAGTVVAVGSSVTDFKISDRVMCGLPFHPCGTCRNCTGPESWRQYCANIEGHSGVQRDGFFAEYALVDARSTTLLPDEVSFLSAAPLACAGRTVWRGVLQADLKPGQWLAIVGSGGGLGHIGIQFAKKRGLRVVGVDARDEGLELSKECGADIVADAREGKDAVVKQILEATDGEGVDAALTISDAPDAAALACALTKMHGLMVQMGQPDVVNIPFADLALRDVRVQGSILCSPEESRGMLKFIAESGLAVKTSVYKGLDKIKELVEMVHAGRIRGKAVIIIDQDQIDREKKSGAKY